MRIRALACSAVLLALASAACAGASAHSFPSNAATRGGAPAGGTDNQARTTSPAPHRQAPAQSAAPAAGAHSGDAATGSGATPPTQQKRYYIELVIFRARVALGSPEDWAAETGMAPTVSGGESPTGSGIGKLLERVPPSQYRLGAIAASLRRSPTYQVVAQAAWEQTASDWGTHAGFTLPQLGIDVPGLLGQVYFERGQFLHLGMTLDYTMQHPPPGLKAAPGTTFVLNEIRRVRFYQRNYYDNPAFGVIALVLPVHGSRPPGR